MTDLLTDVVEGVRDRLVKKGVPEALVADVLVKVEAMGRGRYGGGETYICKVPDRAARRLAIAQQVARGGPDGRVAVVAATHRVSEWTVYDAVKAHSGRGR